MMKVSNMACLDGCFEGAGPELSVAEVRLQQRGLHPWFVSEAEGEQRAGVRAARGPRQLRPTSAGDFSPQHLTGGEDTGVHPAGEGG